MLIVFLCILGLRLSMPVAGATVCVDCLSLCLLVLVISFCVLGFGLITVAWVTMSVICFAYEYFTQANFVNAFSQKLVVTVTYLFAVYFMIAFEIAMKLKFAERSGLATILIMAVMGTLAVLLQVTFDFSLEMVIAEYLGVELLIAAAVVFAAVIYGLYWWSVRIMERREL